MQYGDMNIVVQELEQYLGFNPANENVTTPFLPELNLADTLMAGKELAVNQRDADLLHLWHKVHSFPLAFSFSRSDFLLTISEGKSRRRLRDGVVF